MNSSNQVSHSRAPPSRERYSVSEMDSLMTSSSPVDPLSEDPSVLALFDSLIHNDQDENSIYYDTSSSDDDDDGSAQNILDLLFQGELPFSHLWLSGDSDNDSDATSRDSEVSLAGSSSVDILWSDDEMDEVLEVYTSDFSSSSESEDDGRMGRISNHHDDREGDEDENKSSVAKKRTLERERAQTVSGIHTDRSLEVSSAGDAAACSSREKRSHSQPEPTRHQPSRKVKNTPKDAPEERKGSSAKSIEPVQDGNGGKNRRRQPQRKVKSAQCSTSNGHENVMETNSEPSASGSNTNRDNGTSALVVMATDSQPSPSGSGGIVNGRAVGAGPSRGGGSGQTSGAGSGPSRRWTRKMKMKQQDESGTAEASYEQYHVEDFLKPKSPTSFYSKKDHD